MAGALLFAGDAWWEFNRLAALLMAVPVQGRVRRRWHVAFLEAVTKLD